MRRLGIVLALGLATLAGGGGASAPAAAAESSIERSPEFVSRVSAAIDKGVEYLRKVQAADGGWTDYGGYRGAMTALSYLTLRSCGVPRDDPAAVRAFRAMRGAYEGAARQGDVRTYSAALFAMALAEHGEPVPAPDRDRDPRCRLDATDEAWMKELVASIEGWQDASGRWSYGGTPFGRANRADYDHSNTQYALLGLKSASRAGVKVRTATWMRAVKHLIDAQENSGPLVQRFEPGEKGRTSAKASDHARGWGYLAENPAYGSMTAGGVGSVVICRSELIGVREYGPGLDARAEQSARDGIAWLGRNFSVTTNPPFAGGRGGQVGMSGPGWHYYYLYALERAGVLAAVEWMGEHDWYGEGADFLVRAQLSSGAWQQGMPGGFGAVPGAPPVRAAVASDPWVVQATCFALLFLKKGTAPVARGAITKAADADDINFAAARTLPDADFEDFIDLVLSRWHRATSAESKERLFARATAVGSRIVEPLIIRLSAAKDGEREAAIALLSRAAGVELGYVALAPREEREAAIDRWQAWWLANEATLHYDESKGRLSSGK